MQNEKKKRIAKRFMDDDRPCAVAREGRVHTLSGDYKIVPVDKFSFEKTK